MPTQQGVRLDEATAALHPREQPAQSGEERTILWPERRTGHLPAEDCHFVAEHDHFDGQFGVVGLSETEKLEHAEKGDIEK